MLLGGWMAAVDQGVVMGTGASKGEIRARLVGKPEYVEEGGRTPPGESSDVR